MKNSKIPSMFSWADSCVSLLIPFNHAWYLFEAAIHETVIKANFHAVFSKYFRIVSITGSWNLLEISDDGMNDYCEEIQNLMLFIPMRLSRAEHEKFS